VAARDGVDLMPEQGTKPVNKYLPPRKKDQLVQPAGTGCGGHMEEVAAEPKGFLAWLDKSLEAL